MPGKVCAIGIAMMLGGFGPICFGADSTPKLGTLCQTGSRSVPEDRHVFFPDENTEALALRLSTGLYADEAIYKRLSRDLHAIRALDKKMAPIRYFSNEDGRTLRVVFDSDALSRIRSSQYDSWNCLNSFLGASVTDYSSRLGFVEIRLRGRYNLKEIRELYLALPGVKSVDTSTWVGDGSTIYVTRGESSWKYVFDIAGGDCFAGCSEHELHYFEVNSAGIARAIATCANGCEPLPDWVREYYRRYR